jgi:hypothetical protein
VGSVLLEMHLAGAVLRPFRGDDLCGREQLARRGNPRGAIAMIALAEPKQRIAVDGRGMVLRGGLARAVA